LCARLVLMSFTPSSPRRSTTAGAPGILLRPKFNGTAPLGLRVRESYFKIARGWHLNSTPGYRIKTATGPTLDVKTNKRIS
jgi:hypothetical protein